MPGKRDILEICCKVLGLACLVWGVALLPTAIVRFQDLVGRAGEVGPSLAMVGFPLVYCISAFILLKYPARIAARLAPQDAPIHICTAKEWQSQTYRLCLRVVGAVVLVRGIPQLLQVLVQIAYHHRPARLGPYAWGQLVSAIVYLALGIYFIGGAPLIARIALRGSMRESDSGNI